MGDHWLKITQKWEIFVLANPQSKHFTFLEQRREYWNMKGTWGTSRDGKRGDPGSTTGCNTFRREN